MKVIIVLVLFLIVSVVSASASFEFQEKISPGSLTHTLDFCQSKNLNPHLQISGFALVSNSWAEAYLGPNYSLKPWLRIGCAMGLETDKHPLRLEGSIWLGKGPVFFVGIIEGGGTGLWYNLKAMTKLNRSICVGFMAKRYAGVGPLIQVSLPRVPVAVWVHPARDLEAKKFKTTIGVVLN